MTPAATPRLRTSRREFHDRWGLLTDLALFAAVVMAVAVPFALVHCDPLIDGHGYMGDETMILSLALNGAMDGIQSYGNEPDGTPLVWPGWIPLVTAVYGPALVRTDPLNRVEMGRLISRVLCALGALAWTLSAHYVIQRSPNGWRPRGSTLLLGLLVSVTLLAFPPLVFVASFARNDALGVLLVCLTLSAAVVFVRRRASPGATAVLVFVAGGSFWGHFISLLLSCYLAGVAIVLAAFGARKEGRLGRFCRNVAAGALAGASAWCLVFLWLNARHFLQGSTGGAQASLLFKLSGLLTGHLTDVGSATGRGLQLWTSWKEIPIIVAAVGAWTAVAAIQRRKRPTGGEGSGSAPGPFAVAVLQLPVLTALLGALSRTYPVHDVYRPIVLVSFLSTVLLAIEVQAWSEPTRRRACFAILIATGVGLVAFSHLDTTAFAEFPGTRTEWSGYRPFDHSLEEADRSEPPTREATHRRGNLERRHHLRQVLAYLQRERGAALITFDPMLLLLRRKGLTPYYVHFQVPPAARASEAEEAAQLVFGTIVGRGVRLVAGTRNGLDRRTFSSREQPVPGLGDCLRRNWRRPSFSCRLGAATLTLESAYSTDGGGYTYGYEESTPVRLFRIARVQADGVR